MQGREWKGGGTQQLAGFFLFIPPPFFFCHYPRSVFHLAPFDESQIIRSPRLCDNWNSPT